MQCSVPQRASFNMGIKSHCCFGSKKQIVTQSFVYCHKVGELHAIGAICADCGLRNATLNCSDMKH